MKWVVQLILFSILFTSCQKEGDLTLVDEVFWVRTQGADMPIHLHGNLTSQVILLVVHGGPGGNGLEYRAGKYTVPLEERYAVAIGISVVRE